MPRPQLDLPSGWERFTAAEQGYRFHGKNPPKRVANELPAGPVEDGIATLRLYDPIDSWGGEWGVSAKEFASALDALPDDTHTIHLRINSPGGEVWDGLAIMNQLRNHDAKVVAFVDGIAASAASFIMASADEVVMGRNSEVMIHDARAVAVGNAAVMEKARDLLDHVSDNIASVYAEKAGGTKADWREQMLAETWYSAEEAVAAGLGDRVEGEAQPTDHIDRSLFAHAGRATAPPPNLTHEDAPAANTGEAKRLRHRMRARELGLPA